MVAVVTAGILLVIAMSIGGIALKEQVLSTANKESQVAFYAADNGMECALFLDQKKEAFASDADGNPLTQTDEFSCNDESVNLQLMPGSKVAAQNSDDPAEYSYFFVVRGISVGSENKKTCAVVTVTKFTNDRSKPEPTTNTYTLIQSRGYNTCEASLTRLEIGVESKNY